MDLNRHLTQWKHTTPISPREEAISQTVSRATDALLQQAPLCSRQEFLWSQFRQIRKRWWALQGALLALTALLLPQMEDYFLQVRSVGIVGCLFAVFLIPELWRNRDCDAIQVEAACLYSLRQIYAARFILFGIVDVLLLSLFCWELHHRLGMDIPELVRQLLLPVTVTAGICFQTLSSRHLADSRVCLIASLCWCALWWLLVSTPLYRHIVPGLWLALFVLALVFLIAAVRNTLQSVNQYWEVTIP